MGGIQATVSRHARIIVESLQQFHARLGTVDLSTGDGVAQDRHGDIQQERMVDVVQDPSVQGRGQLNRAWALLARAPRGGQLLKPVGIARLRFPHSVVAVQDSGC